jgi:hypothetical protein
MKETKKNKGEMRENDNNKGRMKGMKKREMIEMKVTKWNKRNESNKGD